MTANPLPEAPRQPAMPSHHHIFAAIKDLETMTQESPTGNVGYILGHILSWMQEGKTSQEKPWLKISYPDQQRMINVLLRILDPREVKLHPIVSPFNGESDIKAVARVRGKALDVLQQIDLHYETYHRAAMPCMGEVRTTVCNLMGNGIVDHDTVDQFHRRITQWPHFLSGYGATEYHNALTVMRDDATRHGDTPRMAWIDEFMRPGSTLRSGRSKPAVTAG
jgi:hypothetical protein